ncbi:MAG TPA: hypothetical protein VGF24_07005 [Vicinamibacterales bacterium]|jgi:hypothetical protein
MLKRGVCTILAGAVMVLATPRTGSAGIGEWIWEMSGPSMIGLTTGCSVGFKKNSASRVDRCSVFGIPIKPRSPLSTPVGTLLSDAMETVPTSLGKIWLVLDGGAYFSLPKNSGEDENEKDFGFFHTGMGTVDPMIGFKSALGEHAVGMTANFVFGKEFAAFKNFGVKVRPISLRWHRVIWEWNIRLYPNGFDVVAGSDPAELKKGDGFEWVNAIAVIF